MEYLELALPISKALNDNPGELQLLYSLGAQLESSEDYYRRLRDCYEKQLALAREIGNRPAEAQAPMFCGQIRGLYLGDYSGGLELLEQALALMQNTPGMIYPLLRIAQIRLEQGRYTEAQAILHRTHPIEDPQQMLRKQTMLAGA